MTMHNEEFQAHKLSVMSGLTWFVEMTGGNCTALVCQLSSAHRSELTEGLSTHYLMVTDEGASVPDPFDTCCLGEYVNDEPVNYWYFANQQDLVNFLQVWNATREGGTF